MQFPEFENKVVLVTGATGNIGTALCKGFDRNSAIVYQTDIRETDRPHFIPGDISDQSFIAGLVERIMNEQGHIDVLVNNAGICPRTPFFDIRLDEWQKVLSVNLTSMFLLSQACMNVMLAQQSGSIISLASLAGQVGGIAVGAHYSATKAAIECMTKTLARNGAQANVRANAVAPGIIDSALTDQATPGQRENFTKTIPLGRLGRVDEVAGPVLFLASDLASYITGFTVDINGGLRM
ncbi:MAG: SDR family oxidoreductase [Chitinivibrionales bacterium]|nr:SDR family oxidoreductase [Chitinivibrionales bacterium]